MSDYSDNDLFKCEECGRVADIEDSIKVGAALLCEECSESTDDD